MPEQPTPIDGQFIVPIKAERVPSSSERKKWQESKRRLCKIDANLYSAYLYLQNIILAAKAAQLRSLTIPVLNQVDMTSEEQRFLTLYKEYSKIKAAMRDVEDMTAGLRPSNGDWDIVRPDESLSGPLLIAAAVAGVVLVSGMIARLIYLEVETQELSENFNEIMDKADAAMCISGPDSEDCQFWKQTKKQEGYKKNVTLADSVKSAVSTIGKGAEMGLLIAIPLVAYAFFKR